MQNRSLMIFLLFFGYVLVYLDKTVIGFALLPISREFNLPAQQLGYITGMFFLAYSLFQIPAGWLNDRFGYKKVLACSLTLLGGFALCFGVLGFGLGLLVTFRFLSGIGHSGYPTSCAKSVVANFALEERTFAQSILLSSAGLAMTLGPLLAVYCLSHFGWRGSFSTLGLMAFAVAALILFLVPSPPKNSQTAGSHASANYLSLLKNPIVTVLFFANFCVNIPAYGLMAWLPKYLVQQRGFSLDVSGLIVAIGGLGIWISSLSTGWLVGKYLQGREPKVILYGSLLSGICIWMVYASTSIYVTCLFLFLGNICLMSSFVTTFTLPMKRLPTHLMGGAIGLLNTGGTLGGFVAPIVMGYLITLTHGYHATFIFLALAMWVSGLLMLPLISKTRLAARDAA